MAMLCQKDVCFGLKMHVSRTTGLHFDGYGVAIERHWWAARVEYMRAVPHFAHANEIKLQDFKLQPTTGVWANGMPVSRKVLRFERTLGQPPEMPDSISGSCSRPS